MIFPVSYSFPFWLMPVFRPAFFRIPGRERSVFLTFDDGPTPGITEFVLDLLHDYQASATFFIIGDKIKENQELLLKTAREGHAIGNHTFHHLDYFKTSKSNYKANIDKTQQALEEMNLNPNKWFRPPYGKISPVMIRHLHREGFRIVMWRLLGFDFDPHVDPMFSLKILKKKIRPGDIIVFHDSEKAFPSMKIILPSLLKYLSRENFSFRNLDQIV